ncbi:MAG: GNAT family N-acetyltransferase [Desulfotignum sp.]|nr:GNAT family N-acetyltransferase [Desulfotignum sp.]MCF8126548.1 GNAT family N-acetyltransferase [Desulfotignum sp.]
MEEPKIPVICRFLQKADTNALMALYKDAGWWDEKCERHPMFLSRVVPDSALFVGAFCKKNMIGMGRALSDLTSDAYIQDVVVLRAFRGKGIGKMIIEKLITGLKNHGVDWIGLIGEPGTRRFYENLGFREMQGHIPYRLKD